ncbi:MAG: hypothetical protein ACOH5I_06915 [Oligoflexus sp.]
MLRVLMFIAMFLLSCGQLEYKNVEYPDNTTSSDNPNDCATGLSAYQSFVRPIIEQRCLNCHVSGGLGASAFSFTREEDETNRALLLILMDGDAERLIAKISAQIPHTGGAVIAEDEIVLFRSFFAVEEVCQGN